MNYNRVNGLANPVSRLVLGSTAVDINTPTDSYPLLDFFFEQGGNCIDTAWLYRKGNSEKCVGAWIESRGIRSKIALIGKGAAPVGFTASSPNLSLAVWNEPMWSDCLSASDQTSREWYRQSGMALFAWSSQASGFFTGRYDGNSADTPLAKEVARVWFNAANFERLERARSLAQSRGVTPNQVALAYVLCESPNTFALIGPQNITELRESIEALSLVLSQSERQWLNLES